MIGTWAVGAVAIAAVFTLLAVIDAALGKWHALAGDLLLLLVAAGLGAFFARRRRR